MRKEQSITGFSAPAPAATAQFASDVQYYMALRPRQLPSRYLYDALGSALFDAICHLPWYRITRAELRLLTAHGREIFGQVPGLSTLVELGPGSGEKLIALVEAGRLTSSHLHLDLIDVSPTALALAGRALAALDNVEIDLHEARYEAGLVEVTARRRTAGRMLALFLGSNIGNFDPPGADAFLHSIRAALGRGDALLLGADLVKPEADLLLAYDDPLGVTAAFNRNLLVRINHELGGNIDVAQFVHRAVWNAQESRVEMHLVSLRRQVVRIDAAGLEFTMEAGESIWTESSYKYEPAGVVDALRRAGFGLVNQWIDRADGFALTLVEAV
jgi:L-histidine N-alpha-methyltransferase